MAERQSISERPARGPLLHLPTRAVLVSKAGNDAHGCAACGRAASGIVLACERCLTWFHDGCYLGQVAPVAEVTQLVTTEEDVMVLCRGCRS